MFGKFRAIWFIFYLGINITYFDGKVMAEASETGCQVHLQSASTVTAVRILNKVSHCKQSASKPGTQFDLRPDETKHLSSDFDMNDAIKNIETFYQITEQLKKVDDIMPEIDVENFYDHMILAVDRIQYAISNPSNLQNFFKANGALKVISTNLKNTHAGLRTKLLQLLKDILDLAPTTENLLPINIIDRLIDIFDKDTNLALKAHALDALHKWLPNNLEAQLRVIKITGLETFYNQVEKLDISAVLTLMDLFNKLIKEHLDIRKDEGQIGKDGGVKMKTYQSIGFLEHLSTSKVCDGLRNIFELLWSYNKNENDNVKVVLELVTNVKPFCLKFYKKMADARNLFEALLKYVTKEDNKEYLKKLDVNITNVQNVLEEYLRKDKSEFEKDEF